VRILLDILYSAVGAAAGVGIGVLLKPSLADNGTFWVVLPGATLCCFVILRQWRLEKSKSAGRRV
jgi:hypothetical protein